MLISLSTLAVRMYISLCLAHKEKADEGTSSLQPDPDIEIRLDKVRKEIK